MRTAAWLAAAAAFAAAGRLNRLQRRARVHAAPLLPGRDPGPALVLAWHRVQEPGDGAFRPNASLAVSPALFRAQVLYLRERFRLVDLDTLAGHLAAGFPAGPLAAITFDDGYADNLAAALPVLEDLGAPATVFVSTGFLDAAGPPWWLELEDLLRRAERLAFPWAGGTGPWPLADAPGKHLAYRILVDRLALAGAPERTTILAGLRDQVPAAPPLPSPFLDRDGLARLAASPLVTIGAHGIGHHALSALPEDAACREIAGSKAALEGLLGRPVRHLAYPYGQTCHFGPREMRLAREAGFATAATNAPGVVRPGDADLPWRLPRTCASDLEDLPEFAARLGRLPRLRGAAHA